MDEITSINVENRIDCEIATAIAMALDRYNAEEHDCESFVLTIKPIRQVWGSHQSTLRQLPKKK